VVAHARDVDIEESVAVVVRDDGHASPTTWRDARSLRDVDETPSTPVAIQAVAALHGRHEEIRPAVVVVVE
jgi:hypothetical protein